MRLTFCKNVKNVQKTYEEFLVRIELPLAKRINRRSNDLFHQVILKARKQRKTFCPVLLAEEIGKARLTVSVLYVFQVFTSPLSEHINDRRGSRGTAGAPKNYEYDIPLVPPNLRFQIKIWAVTLGYSKKRYCVVRPYFDRHCG